MFLSVSLCVSEGCPQRPPFLSPLPTVEENASVAGITMTKLRPSPEFWEVALVFQLQETPLPC